MLDEGKLGHAEAILRVLAGQRFDVALWQRVLGSMANPATRGGPIDPEESILRSMIRIRGGQVKTALAELREALCSDEKRGMIVAALGGIVQMLVRRRHVAAAQIVESWRKSHKAESEGSFSA
jgi:hypothetical protein